MHAELLCGRAGHEDVTTIEAANWISVHPLQQPETLRSQGLALGSGEREAIALALEIGGDITVVVDDWQGRRAAAALGIGMIGTVGVLVTAEKLGFLAEIRPLLDDLRAAGLYQSEREYRHALPLAGE